MVLRYSSRLMYRREIRQKHSKQYELKFPRAAYTAALFILEDAACCLLFVIVSKGGIRVLPHAYVSL